MPIEIVDADPHEPLRIGLYGGAGLGKTTAAAQAEDVIFIPTENGASRVKDRNGRPVKLFKGVAAWDNVLESLNYLRSKPHDFRSVVIDSATALEKMAHTKITAGTGKSMKTVDKGYGAGTAKSDQMHIELISLCEEIRVKKEMNIIITAHAQVKTVKDPEATEDYDQFELKLEKGVAGLWTEYLDCLFFMRLSTVLKTSEDAKARAFSDGSRIVCTTQAPAYQAKTRFNTPDKMPLTLSFWDDFMGYVAQGPRIVSIGEVTEDSSELEVDQAVQDNGALISDLLAMVAEIPDDAKKKATLDFIDNNQADRVKLEAIRERMITLRKEREEK